MVKRLTKDEEREAMAERVLENTIQYLLSINVPFGQAVVLARKAAIAAYFAALEAR